jgi:hypothetical protein
MTLEYKLNHSGLGTMISLLSMLMSAGRLVKLYADRGQVIHKLKLLLDISDDRLIVSDKHAMAQDISTQLSDHGKYFSPYFDVDHVQVLGHRFPTQRSKKPCIGLAMYANVDSLNPPSNRHPYNRYYPQEVYAGIFRLITASGHDVITFNSHGVDLEHKIFMLNNLCEAVIGYEGGMCHLAHVLKIPSIILPYHHDGGNEKRALRDEHGKLDIPLLYATHMLHVDRRTYFLESEHEILAWTPDQLKQHIIDLHHGQGNNVLFDNAVIDSGTLRVRTQVPGLNNIDPHLTDFERNFIQTYIPELKFG